MRMIEGLACDVCDEHCMHERSRGNISKMHACLVLANTTLCSSAHVNSHPLTQEVIRKFIECEIYLVRRVEECVEMPQVAHTVVSLHKMVTKHTY